MAILETLNNPEDVKKLNQAQLPLLAEELRRYMVQEVSRSGGHLAPSLGVTELVIAMCRSFDFPHDRVVFDVGHQSYAYKILTGRRDAFRFLRREGGLSGFPKCEESVYDAFNTGHSSTSVSAALGIAVARDLKKEDYKVVAVIGDGALTGGMAYEALNNAGSRNEDLIVILNDNQMSISPNVGAVSEALARARTAPNYGLRKEKIKRVLKKTSGGKKMLSGLRRVRDSLKYLMMEGMLFEEMGFTYLGPVDGHDISSLEQYLGYCKQVKGPVLLHVLTKKGKGYPFAEAEPDKFHGIAPFDPQTGIVLNRNAVPSFSSVFGKQLVQLAQTDERIASITAAMPDGTGLKQFSEILPERFFDVGIAEPHALTYGAGLARNGMKPCVAIYSSFIQRGVDQIYHDICLQKLPVVLGIDRAGNVGEDGETHQGLYDISLLRSFPYLTMLAPGTQKEMEEMLPFAFSLDTPCALRYPRGSVSLWDTDFCHQPIEMGKGELIKEGQDILLIPLGPMMDEAIQAEALLNTQGIDVGIWNPRFIKPLDTEFLMQAAEKYRYIITVEDHAVSGGFGSAVGEFLNTVEGSARLHCIGYPDMPIPQGKRKDLMARFKVDYKAIAEKVLAVCGK